MRIIVLILLSLIAQSAVAQVRGTNRRADLNRDGEVNVGDANVVLEDILSSTNDLMQCDINSDGAVNLGDLNEVLNIILVPDEVHEPAEYLSGTLPVMYIDTEGYRTIDSKEHYWEGTYWLDPMGQSGVSAIGSADAPLALQIKGRGNASWKNFVKKPYRLKFNAKAGPLGMNKSKHFVLLPHADQDCLLLDEMGFELSRRLGLAYTPRQLPVEVVLNGEYLGLYFLCEHIRVANDRVDIEEQKDNECDPNKVTGGWLIEIANYWYNATFSLPEAGKTLFIESHSPEVLSNVQRDYITGYLTNMIKAVYAPNKKDNSWQRYIDIESLARFYIIQEMLDNIESFSGSCYMYKEDGEGEKLHFGPVWDFGQALWRESRGGALGKPFYNVSEDPSLSYCNNHLIVEIVKYPVFYDTVKEIWREFYTEQNMEGFYQYLRDYSMSFREAGNADLKRWHPTFNDDYYQTMLDRYIALVEQRCEWLNNLWGDGTP